MVQVERTTGSNGCTPNRFPGPIPSEWGLYLGNRKWWGKDDRAENKTSGTLIVDVALTFQRTGGQFGYPGL
jgi:hypothetical protein